MAVKKHTTVRLSDATRNKLNLLVKLDNLSISELINNLILTEYGRRKEEIEEFKKIEKENKIKDI